MDLFTIDVVSLSDAPIDALRNALQQQIREREAKDQQPDSRIKNNKKTGVALEFIPRSGPDILWSGNPFLIVGTAKQANAFLNLLAKNDFALLNDHAYFWVLYTDDRMPSGQSSHSLPQCRSIFFWAQEGWSYVIAAELVLLRRFEKLVGLSHATREIRWRANAVLETLPATERTDATKAGNQNADKESDSNEVGKKKRKSPTPHLYDQCLLIVGESGSGKSELARTLGESRSDRVGIVDCGGIPSELLTSEIFGHEANAFTNAERKRDGLIKSLANGTLIINDLDAAPLTLQAALLGYLDDGRVRPVGADLNGIATVDTWLIFTTNCNIRQSIAEGRFRQDFVFRCEERVIVVPPLRSRRADIPAYARKVWKERQDRSLTLSDLNNAAIRWLCNEQRQWLGNFRTLRAFLGLCGSLEWRHGIRPWTEVFEQVMKLGDSPLDWIGLIETTEAPPTSGGGPMPGSKPTLQQWEKGWKTLTAGLRQAGLTQVGFTSIDSTAKDKDYIKCYIGAVLLFIKTRDLRQFNSSMCDEISIDLDGRSAPIPSGANKRSQLLIDMAKANLLTQINDSNHPRVYGLNDTIWSRQKFSMDRVCHFEVPYSDKQRMERFYSNIFGWQFMPAPGDVPYTFVITTENR